MKNTPSCLLAALILCAAAPVAHSEEWVAYNDCVDTDAFTTPANATNFGLGRSYFGDGSSGNLLDFATGQDTGVTATFVENFSAGNTINWATDFADFTIGTDAEQTFGGKLNLAGNMSYNDAPGWSLDLIFTGLDPAGTYTFAGTVNRNGGDAYRNRITNWRLMGADSSTFASTAGTQKVNETSVEFNTGHNPEGYVARWTDIQPGADGSFTIRTTHGLGEAGGGLPNPDSYRGYAGGLFLLEAQAAGSQQPVLLSIETEPGSGAATITWRSQPGHDYVVEASSDLDSWRDLDGVVMADAETAFYIEPGALAADAIRFYRVREAP